MTLGKPVEVGPEEVGEAGVFPERQARGLGRPSIHPDGFFKVKVIAPLKNCRRRLGENDKLDCVWARSGRVTGRERTVDRTPFELGKFDGLVPGVGECCEAVTDGVDEVLG